MIKYEELIGLKILVTGGAGFIGSNLCEFLLKKGCLVTCLDNLSTGNISNIKDFYHNKNFKFIEGDICDLKTCINATKDIQFVLHQAALGSVPRSIEDPIKTNEANISGFINMIFACKENNIERFIFASSSSVYGTSKNSPKIEDIIGEPLSPYSITKFVNELYAKNFSKLYKIDFIGLRYFNVFGKRQDPDGSYAAVIPKFIKKIIKGESPVINGDGTYSRDFTFIDNVIQMNILAILTKNKKALNQIYNTAYGDSTTLNDLVRILKKYLSDYNKNIKNIIPIHGPERTGDIPHSLSSIVKGINLLGYNPKYNLEEGIKKSVKWYWNNLK